MQHKELNAPCKLNLVFRDMKISPNELKIIFKFEKYISCVGGIRILTDLF